MSLDLDRLHELLDYDSATGWFTNTYTRGRAQEGARAGNLDTHGYRKITIDYVRYYEHHLAWFYIYGEWPDEMDHKDGVRSNNAIDNLRIASHMQNCFNTKRDTGSSGLRGAYLNKRTTSWYSQIQLGGIVHYLGTFDTALEAHNAFMSAVELHHGEFALHNRGTLLGAK